VSRTRLVEAETWEHIRNPLNADAHPRSYRCGCQVVNAVTVDLCEYHEGYDEGVAAVKYRAARTATDDEVTP